MLKKLSAAVFVVAGVSLGGTSAQALPELEQYAFVIDGVCSHFSAVLPPAPCQTGLPLAGPLGGAPAGVDLSSFSPGSGQDGVPPPPLAIRGTGLGEIRISISGAGDHYVGVFLDHEISEPTNTFLNETGMAVGTPAPGQTWEIDAPEVSGANLILGDLSAMGLLNCDFTDPLTFPAPPAGPCLPIGLEGIGDISLAMAYSFTLDPDEDAVVSFTVSDMEPPSGFFLKQTDTNSGEVIYLSGHVSRSSIPEPGTLAIFGAGLVALGGLRRARRAA